MIYIYSFPYIAQNPIVSWNQLEIQNPFSKLELNEHELLFYKSFCIILPYHSYYSEDLENKGINDFFPDPAIQWYDKDRMTYL
jgi:hypothetical protein